MEAKQALRRTGVASRRGRERDPRLAAHLEPLIAGAARIASYVPVPGEPGLDPRPGWLLPVVLPGRVLDWAEHDGSLTEGWLHEPTGPRLGPSAIASCDLVLVPALVVDRHGYRLGKGGGFYDAALTRATGLTVALLHDGELVEELPREPHDVPVLAVATPSTGLLRLPAKYES